MKPCLLDYLNSVLHLSWKKKIAFNQHSSPLKLYQAKKKKKASLDNTVKNPAALGNVSGVQLCSLAEDSSQEDVLGMVLTARHNARDINGST